MPFFKKDEHLCPFTVNTNEKDAALCSAKQKGALICALGMLQRAWHQTPFCSCSSLPSHQLFIVMGRVTLERLQIYVTPLRDIHLSICLSVYPSISTHPSTYPYVHPTIHMFFHLFICLSIYPFTHPSIYSTYPLPFLSISESSFTDSLLYPFMLHPLPLPSTLIQQFPY